MTHGLNKYSEKERRKIRREYKDKRDKRERKVKIPHSESKWKYNEFEEDD